MSDTFFVTEDGWVKIKTRGEGLNKTPFRAFLNERFAPGVFAWADSKIKAAVESRFNVTIEPYKWYNNFCGLSETFC